MYLWREIYLEKWNEREYRNITDMFYTLIHSLIRF